MPPLTTGLMTEAFALGSGPLISPDMKTLTAALALTLSAAAAPGSAQESSPAVSETASEAEAEMPVYDRWVADPTQIFDGSESDLAALQWRLRPVVVFAESEFDPNFQRQMELLAVRPEDLAERDVILIRDTDAANPSALRLQLRPRGFMLALIGKDGTVYLRKPFPWDVRELSRSIDKMPIRQQEIEDRRGT